MIGFIFFICIFSKHNAYFVSCKFKTQYHDLSYNLKEYINKNLLTIGDITPANEVLMILQDYTSNIRNGQISSIASGIFPTIRYFRYIYFIAFSMPDFRVFFKCNPESEISKLLGGVETAFYVSIMVFSYLFGGLFEKLGDIDFDHDTFVIKKKIPNISFGQQN